MLICHYNIKYSSDNFKIYASESTTELITCPTANLQKLKWAMRFDVANVSDNS